MVGRRLTVLSQAVQGEVVGAAEVWVLAGEAAQQRLDRVQLAAQDPAWPSAAASERRQSGGRLVSGVCTYL